jgi:DNA replication licensing factor MCM2
MDNMEQDYEARPELDRYEADGIDDDMQNELSAQGRMAAEIDLDEQDRRQVAMGTRRPRAFMDDEFDDDQDEILHN